MNKLLWAALMVAGVALAGCGGSSNSNTPMDMDDDTETFTNARCVEINGPGHVANSDGDGCIDDPRIAQNEENEKNATMMATDAKALFSTISALTGEEGAAAVTDRIAFYAGTNDAMIHVRIGDGTNIPSPVPLSLDKDTTVDELHGWTGERFHRKATDADKTTYEAHVYSHIGDPKQGRKFGSTAAVTTEGEYEYQLTDGLLTINTATGEVQMRVDSPMFDQSAGEKVFKKDDNEVTKMISGSYHGVSGTYNCTPAANACSATVAAKGFTLGGGTWTFKPTDPEARVMSSPDNAYASFGWWKHTKENGDPAAVSAFFDYKGTASAAAGLTNLNGAATYSGAAAGQYALSSSTGGTNDAGHFTAKAMLTANFTDNTDDTAITGTINDFVGADGESRNWSIKLNGSSIGDTGVIGAATNGTVWTIGSDAADASGSWDGTFYETTGDDTGGVPQTGAGVFYSEYGRAGKMVGGFGVSR